MILKQSTIWHTSRARAGLAALLALATSACVDGRQSGPAPTSPGSVAAPSAATDGWPRRPVVVVPDIEVSRLVDPANGEVVWDGFAGIYPSLFQAESAQAITLPMAEGRPFAELNDGLRPEVIADAGAGAFGFDAGPNLHAGVVRALNDAGYRTSNEQAAAGSLLVFAYDWRRDLVENARNLARFITAQAGPARPVDIVGEGAGALIVRYFLLYGDQDLPPNGLPAPNWSGAQRVERAVLVTPPNAGTTSSLLRLIRGDANGRLSPAVIGTFPSAYQLMPRTRHGAVRAQADGSLQNHLDPALWQQAGWGLAGASDEDLAVLLPDVGDPEARRRTASDYQARALARAERVMQALDRTDAPPLPERLDLHLLAGDGQTTPLRLGYDPAAGRLDVIETATGDGTVPRASALLDERLSGMTASAVTSPLEWRSVHLFEDDAVGLAADPAFASNLRFLLVGAPDGPWDGRFDRAQPRAAAPSPVVPGRATTGPSAPGEGPRRLF